MFILRTGREVSLDDVTSPTWFQCQDAWGWGGSAHTNSLRAVDSCLFFENSQNRLTFSDSNVFLFNYSRTSSAIRIFFENRKISMHLQFFSQFVFLKIAKLDFVWNSCHSLLIIGVWTVWGGGYRWECSHRKWKLYSRVRSSWDSERTNHYYVIEFARECYQYIPFLPIHSHDAN